jgi:hypothetical protein
MNGPSVLRTSTRVTWMLPECLPKMLLTSLRDDRPNLESKSAGLSVRRFPLIAWSNARAALPRITCSGNLIVRSTVIGVFIVAIRTSTAERKTGTHFITPSAPARGFPV